MTVKRIRANRQRAASPSSRSVNRPIWGNSLKASRQMAPAHTSKRTMAIWSCFIKRGRVLLFSPFLSTRQIKFCGRRDEIRGYVTRFRMDMITNDAITMERSKHSMQIFHSQCPQSLEMILRTIKFSQTITILHSEINLDMPTSTPLSLL